MDVQPLSMQIVSGWRVFQMVTGSVNHVVVVPVDNSFSRILANMPKRKSFSVASNANLNIILAACVMMVSVIHWIHSWEKSGFAARTVKREVGLEKNLTWRLVQSLGPDTCGIDASKIEAEAENHCKLSVALDVMYELFELVKRPRGEGDLAEDVIFSRWSKYKRLNFSGFYTVLLERNDELVTVGTVRILGKKVAEMPFISTRFQHRQLGMCWVLMDELEKVLIGLGVERLVLPAVPCVLNTWINKFGFTKMTISERKDFLQFTFLEFGRTILCQKILIKYSSADPIPSTVSLGEPDCNIVRIEDNSASDDRSEVHQAKQHHEESSSTKNPP